MGLDRRGRSRICGFNVQFSTSHGFPVLLTVLLATFASAAPVEAQRRISHTTTDLYDAQRRLNVQIVAVTCSSVSLVATFTAFYWFLRMEKRFRHRLIMLLIYGDAVRAISLFTFAVISIARGQVTTRSAFCQASGFLLQYGTETSDLSVLAMAVHSALQVFRPSTSSRTNGLYPYRRAIYLATFLVPLLMASLAFLNPRYGYLSQGAFCSLPLRPFWYRLALNWVPRYLIAGTIMGIAVAIYAHVGFEFRRFAEWEEARESFSSAVETSVVSSGDGHGEEGGGGGGGYGGRRFGSLDEPVAGVARGACGRRGSVAGSLPLPSGGGGEGIILLLPSSTSTHSAPQQQQQQHQHSRRTSTSVPFPFPHFTPPHPPPILSPPTPPPPPSSLPHTRARARIHAHLRLLFIYPLLYIFLWLLPFVSHCMNYSDRFARRPVYGLSVATVVCVAGMGAVDCAVFCVRERPWRGGGRGAGRGSGVGVGREGGTRRGDLVGLDGGSAGGKAAAAGAAGAGAAAAAAGGKSTVSSHHALPPTSTSTSTSTSSPLPPTLPPPLFQRARQSFKTSSLNFSFGFRFSTGGPSDQARDDAARARARLAGERAERAERRRTWEGQGGSGSGSGNVNGNEDGDEGGFNYGFGDSGSLSWRGSRRGSGMGSTGGEGLGGSGGGGRVLETIESPGDEGGGERLGLGVERETGKDGDGGSEQLSEELSEEKESDGGDEEEGKGYTN